MTQLILCTAEFFYSETAVPLYKFLFFYTVPITHLNPHEHADFLRKKRMKDKMRNFYFTHVSLE